MAMVEGFQLRLELKSLFNWFIALKQLETEVTRQDLFESSIVICNCSEISNLNGIERLLIVGASKHWINRYQAWEKENPSDWPIESRNKIRNIANKRYNELLSPEERFDKAVTRNQKDKDFLRLNKIKI